MNYRDPELLKVLVLQGGAALGAYQAGAYEALAEAGHLPRWVAGTSIGAINAASWRAGHTQGKRAGSQIFRYSRPQSTKWECHVLWEDPLFWICVLPGVLLGAYAQSRIKINMAKYSQVRTLNGITGAEVARQLLD